MGAEDGALVAVVGCGSIGLTAVRWARERGLRVAAFDRSAGCGGVWRAGPPGSHSPAYDSLFTNSSQRTMQLSDFPFPFETSGPFPRHDEILRYYEAYAEHFDLNRHIRWNTEVFDVRKADGATKWTVRARECATGRELPPVMADFVMVCTGKLWDPSLPDWASTPARRAALGDRIVVHSNEYRNPVPFRGGDVLVVGVGNSALDVALELAQDPQVGQVYMSARRGTTVIPTQDSSGHPHDLFLTSRFFQYKLPSKLRMLYMYRMTKAANEAFAKAGLPPPPGGLFSPQSPGSNLKQAEAFMKELNRGRIRIVSGFAGETTADGHLVLADGTVLDAVKGIIACTGYKTGLNRTLSPSLAAEIMREIPADEKSGRPVPYLHLYKRTLYPADPSLFLLGFITSFGNEACVGEMQARWATAMAAGQIATPSPAELAQGANQFAANVHRLRPSVAEFVRFIPFVDDLAADLGCSPPEPLEVLKSRWFSPAAWRLAYNLTFGPVIQSQFRLRGRDADPSRAENILVRSKL